jgi:hypothetical protein
MASSFHETTCDKKLLDGGPKEGIVRAKIVHKEMEASQRARYP